MLSADASFFLFEGILAEPAGRISGLTIRYASNMKVISPCLNPALQKTRLHYHIVCRIEHVKMVRLFTLQVLSPSKAGQEIVWKGAE